MPRHDDIHELFGTIKLTRESVNWVYGVIIIFSLAYLGFLLFGNLLAAVGVIGCAISTLWYVLYRSSVHWTDEIERSYYKNEILAEHVAALLKRVEALEGELAGNGERT